MRSRRVPVLRLGSTGPGGDARSLRLRPQASASVRGASHLCRTCIGLASDLPETKIVAKCRTVVTFYVSYLKSVNGHRDRGGRGRKAQNCRHFWTRLGSSRFRSVNSHTDRGFLVAKRRNVVTFGLVSGLRVSKVSTVTCRDRGGPGRETQNCRHFWTRLGSSRLKSVNGHMQGSGRSWSRNAELSSLLDSSRVFASQKCQRSHAGIGAVLVAKRRTVVTFGLVSGLRVSKVSTVTCRDRGGPGRETQNCRHFWTRLGSSRFKSVNSRRDRGGPGREMQNCRHFWPCLWREERREERGEKRGERSGDRGEERRERREERGEKREERRERREEIGERREERGEKRGERREDRREERGEGREEREEEKERGEKRDEEKEGGEKREEEQERGEKREEEKEEKGMTPDLSLLSGFTRGVLLSLHVRDTCLHSGSWLPSVFFPLTVCLLQGDDVCSHRLHLL